MSWKIGKVRAATKEWSFCSVLELAFLTQKVSSWTFRAQNLFCNNFSLNSRMNYVFWIENVLFACYDNNESSSILHYTCQRVGTHTGQALPFLWIDSNVIYTYNRNLLCTFYISAPKINNSFLSHILKYVKFIK